MKGPAGVMALILGEAAVGGVMWLFLTPLWNEVKRGFFTLTGIVLIVVGVGAWGAAASATIGTSPAGRWSAALALAFAALTSVWVAFLIGRSPRAGRAVGLASVPVSVAILVAMAGTAEGSDVVAFLQLLGGAAFLGAVMDGLLLGHWYLTDRGLTRRPINRATTFLIAAVALEAAAVAAGGFGTEPVTSDINPLLSAAGLASWIALGMVGATGLVAVMIRVTLRGQRASAVQSATGFFYLAVIFAFTAEVAAKVRFLP